MTRRILVINPNTSEAATARIRAQAERTARTLAGVTTTTVAGPFGAETIASAAEAAIAAHAVLLAAARAIDQCDAIVVAAFIDPGLAALREVAGKPCAGLCESAMLAAAAGRRFGIVTPGAHLDAALRDLAARYGVADRLVDIAYVEGGIGAVAYDPERFRGAIEAAIADLARAGAAAVVIGGGPLAGLAETLAAPGGVTLVDGIDAAVRRAAILPMPAADARPTGGGDYVGLEPSLVRLLGGGSVA